MKYISLKLLAKEILAHSDRPLSKVRFAKIIYFVFKHFVKQNIYESKDLAFIRMPLGPVPDGFMDLDNDQDMVIKNTNVGLMYNRQSYSLNDKESYLATENASEISRIVKKLESYSTSKLIEVSHEDYSWKTHINGDKYFLVEEDLGVSMPRSGMHIEHKLDDQLIQARLVHGMENDAVIDSTYLEYPNIIDVE